MATVQAKPYNGQVATPPTLAGADQGYGARGTWYYGTYTWASDAAATIIQWFSLPAGGVPLLGFLMVDTSTGSTTLNVGVSGDTARYKAAAAITTTNLPTFFLSNIAGTTPYLTSPLAQVTQGQIVQSVTAAATAPSGGIIMCAMLVAVS